MNDHTEVLMHSGVVDDVVRGGKACLRGATESRASVQALFRG